MRKKAIDALAKFIELEAMKNFTADTITRKQRDIRDFLKYIRGRFEKVSFVDAGRYIDKLKRMRRPEYINSAITHLRQFYIFLVGQGELLINPFVRIDRMKEDSRNIYGIFSEKEIKSILEATESGRRKTEAIRKRDMAIIELLYSTGIRSSELINLNVDDIDFANGEVVIFKGKNDTERIVPVGDEALSAIGEYLKVRENLLNPGIEQDALFLSRYKRRIAGISIRRMIHRRKDEAGVKSKGTIHAFRHSFASHILRRGAGLEVIGRMLGHECIESVRRYTHISDNGLREAYNESHPKALCRLPRAWPRGAKPRYSHRAESRWR